MTDVFPYARFEAPERVTSKVVKPCLDCKEPFMSYSYHGLARCPSCRKRRKDNPPPPPDPSQATTRKTKHLVWGGAKTRKSPRTYSMREPESPIQEYRLSRGWTVRELCEEAETTPVDIYNLSYGVMAPIFTRKGSSHVVGQIKPVALRIADALNVSVADLFPRYICSVHRGVEEYCPEQVADISVSEHSLDASSGTEALLLKEELKVRIREEIGRLRPLEEIVVMLRFFEGASLEAIGKRYRKHKEWIRTIEKRALRKLRYPSVRKRLLDGDPHREVSYGEEPETSTGTS